MGDSKAKELVLKAEKKNKAFSLFSNSNKEEAIELFDKAAAQFKINKEWDEAGKAYVRAAEVSEHLKMDLETCNYYSSAGKAFKNGSIKEAIRCFKLCVTLHMDNNRFSTAAKIFQQIAELEEKAENIPGAIQAYEKAAECFFSEDSHSSGNQMLLKIAHFAAEREDYKKAIDIFEKVSAASLDNKLLSYSVKDYLFEASLIQLVMGAKHGDSSNVIIAVEKYKDLHPAYDGSRECKFIENVTTAYQEDDLKKFVDTVFNYDKIYKLDTWTSGLLLAVKNTMGDSGQKIEITDSSTSSSSSSSSSSKSKNQKRSICRGTRPNTKQRNMMISPNNIYFIIVTKIIFLYSEITVRSFINVHVLIQ